MCEENNINLFIEIFSNLKKVSLEGVDKQKLESIRKKIIFSLIITKKSTLFYYHFTIAKMVVLWNTMEISQE